MRLDSFYFLCRDVSFSSYIPFCAERCQFKSKTCNITYFDHPHLVSVLALYNTVQWRDSARKAHLKMRKVFQPNSSLNTGCMQVSRLCHVVLLLHIFNTDLESYYIHSSQAKNPPKNLISGPNEACCHTLVHSFVPRYICTLYICTCCHTLVHFK